MELDFFRARGGPYYVYAPDYRPNSTGIRALHQLCHVLNELGEEAYIAQATITHLPLRTPRLTSEVLSTHFLTGRVPIAVYPEVVIGNPLGTPLVARWMLNKPGHLGGEKSYAASEILFFFEDWIVPKEMRPRATYLGVATLDISIFNNENNPYDRKRRGTCVFANKYLAAGGYVDPQFSDATDLGLTIQRTPDEIADILRKSEVLYCYEHSSIIQEALVCGCPVLLVPTTYWPCDQESSWLTHPGIGLANRPGDLEVAQRSIAAYSNGQRLKSLQGTRQASVETFVGITQAYHDHYLRGGGLPPYEHGISPPKLGVSESTFWTENPKLRRTALFNFLSFYQIDSKKIIEGGDSLGRVLQGYCQTQDHKTSAAPANIGPAELALFDVRLKDWPVHPLFHIVIVEDDQPESAITRTMQSVLHQHYSNAIATVIAPRAAPYDLGEGRLEWWQTADNPWLLANEAITKSPAEWCGVVRAGDSLANQALLMFAEFVHAHPECRVIYCDEDVIDGDAKYSSPRLKPDFDIEQLRCNGYIGSLIMARRKLWQTVGGWRPLPRGVDELDAALRLCEACSTGEFGHLPGIYFHRDSTDPALIVDTPKRQEFRRLVVQEHLARLATPAIVENGLVAGHVRVRYSLERPPLISILIPTRDQATLLESCLNSLVELNEYPNFEILLIDNGSEDVVARAYLDGIAQLGNEQIRVLPYKDSFNLAAIFNFGASQAKGDLLLLLHDDIATVHPDWLSNMAAFCLQAGVGAVGSRLLQKDGTLQQGWLPPIKAGITAAPFVGWPLDAADSQKLLNSDQETTAVSNACMLIRKDAFVQVGGMDAVAFPTALSDIDFCLKLRTAGYRILWTPYATLLHDSDDSLKGNKDDNNALLAKWGKAMVEDPFCNPYLAIGGDAYQMETEQSFLPDIITWHPLPNVYAMSSDFDGAGHYRVIQPTQGATEGALVRGRVGRGYPIPALIEKLDIDVIFSQRQVEDLQLRNLARYRKLLRCRIVIDIDDLITNVPDKNIHKKTLLKDMKGRMRQLAAVAHRFTVSTEPLAEDFRQYHDDVRVVPNSLMRHQWAGLTSQRRTSRKMRVGWAGGVSHQGDLEIIRDVVRDLSGEVEWVFMGMCLKELAPHIKEFHEGAVFSAYPAKLASLNLDLAIAPLEINRFNECKSHLRLLEYGILGIPVIATDIHPYRGGFPVSRVKNKHKDWVRAIRDHVNNPDETYRRGDQLKQYILDNWMLDQHLAEWVDAWKA